VLSACRNQAFQLIQATVYVADRVSERHCLPIMVGGCWFVVHGLRLFPMMATFGQHCSVDVHD